MPWTSSLSLRILRAEWGVRSVFKLCATWWTRTPFFRQQDAFREKRGNWFFKDWSFVRLARYEVGLRASTSVRLCLNAHFPAIIWGAHLHRSNDASEFVYIHLNCWEPRAEKIFDYGINWVFRSSGKWRGKATQVRRKITMTWWAP